MHLKEEEILKEQLIKNNIQGEKNMANNKQQPTQYSLSRDKWGYFINTFKSERFSNW